MSRHRSPSHMRFVSPRLNLHKWAVKKAGAARAAVLTDTKEEAVQIARDQARKNKEELVVQNRGGQIHLKNSYGNDSSDIPG